MFLYKRVSIYADPKENLLIIPTSITERWGSLEVFELVISLNAPYTDEELENHIVLALEKCNTIEINHLEKLSALERYLNVKGYSKAVKDKKCVSFRWVKDEGYIITPTEKIPRKGFVHMKEVAIKLDKEVKKGDFARAIKEAISLSK